MLEVFGERVLFVYSLLDDWSKELFNKSNLWVVHFGSLTLCFLRIEQVEEVDRTEGLLNVLNVRWHFSFCDWWSVLKPSFIKLWRWKRSNSRIHSVLDFEHYSINSTFEKPLEHRSAVPCTLCVLTESCSRQLLLVTDENDLLWLVLEWDEVVELDTLACFVNNQVVDVSNLQMIQFFIRWHGERCANDLGTFDDLLFESYPLCFA